MKNFILLIILAIGLTGLPGCATKLDPAGAYHGDTALYEADTVITSAYDVLHTFVKWEADNRTALSELPEVTKAADFVRDHARSWISTAISIREAYSKSPTPDNRTALQSAISVLQTAMSEATKYLASKPIKKVSMNSDFQTPYGMARTMIYEPSSAAVITPSWRSISAIDPRAITLESRTWTWFDASRNVWITESR